VIRVHQPGVGWVRPDGTGEVIPERPTVRPEDLARLADLDDDELQRLA